MKTLFQSLCILLVILFPAITQAQNSSGESKTEAINQIFEKIPIEERLGEAPEKLKGFIAQNPFGLQSSQNEKMMDAFQNTFEQDSLLKYAKETFYQNYKPEAADAVLQWFRKENTQTILKAENEFYTIQGIRLRVVNKYEMEQNPPPQNRIELIKSLSDQISAVDTEIESQVTIFQALVSAFSSLSTQQSLTEAQIEGAADNYRYQVQSQINQEVTNQLLTTYHGLENEKLQDQIAFYETEPGKWLSSSISESMISAYQIAAERFLDSIQDL